MKILFVAAQLYIPQLYGGVQTSTDELCRSLTTRGHKVSLLVKAMPGRYFGAVMRVKMKIRKMLGKGSIARDFTYGYPVWRTWFPDQALNYVCEKERPDLIVVMTGGKIMPLVKKVKEINIPVLVQLHDIAFEEYGKDLFGLGDVPYIANSQFTADKYFEKYGISSTVINPFVATSRYKAKCRGENITFINPVYEKGLDTAIEIARLCPEIPFVFIEGWVLSKSQRSALNLRLSKLKNITLRPSERDMSKIYSKCKILLVPSLFQETFGRVVAEAQANSIPVIASSRGGLPETVGDGGIIVRSDDVSVWAKHVQHLWSDKSYYSELSSKAYSHAARPSLNHDYQSELWEKTMAMAVSRNKSQ